ncbi:MAG: hypothetical protein AAB367_02140 [Patescibacteria group bacterium]
MEGTEEKLHLGYRHGFIGNPKGFVRDGVAIYKDMFEKKDPHTPYLQGSWIVRADEIEYDGEPGDGYLALDCAGGECVPLGDKEKFDIEEKDGITHLVPRLRGARLREIILM